MTDVSGAGWRSMRLSGSGFAVAEHACWSGTGGASRWTWRDRLSRIARTPVLACVDQAVVSGASFLTLIMVARWTDAAQLGIFAILISVLGMAAAVQNSLVSLPYTIQLHRRADRAGEHAFSSLLQSAALSLCAAVLLSAAAAVLGLLGGNASAVRCVWTLAAVLPFFLTKEFARDFAMARLQVPVALVLDASASIAQLGILIWLASSGRLSPFSACAALGVACAITASGWLYATRSDFAVKTAHLATMLGEAWRLGRWLLLSRLAILAQGYSTYWLALLIAGAASAGIYAACMSVVGFANPLMLGLYNLLLPRSVLAWKDQGPKGLRDRAVKDALLLGSIMGIFTLVVLIYGERIMRVFYHGGAYDEHGATIVLLSVGTLVAAVGLPAANGLATMERPRPMAVVAGGSTVLNVLLVWICLIHWGLLGAALGVLAANSIAALGRWVAFLRNLNDAPDGDVAESAPGPRSRPETEVRSNGQTKPAPPLQLLKQSGEQSDPCAKR
jgi:O-antigen/teichoic acid export membrane protein